MSQERLQRVKSLGVLFDSQFRGPFGFRFGLDGLLGLIPVFGDLATAAVSFFIISEAAALGASPIVLIRMALNVAFENIIGIIPIVGDIFDFFWKSNNRNIKLLDYHVQNPKAATVRSRIVVALFFIILLALTIASVIGGFYTLKAFVLWLMEATR